MKNPLITVPLTDADKSLLDKLQANDGFKLLMACLKARRDEHLLTAAYVRVDSPTPNGKEESEHNFMEAQIFQTTIETIENTIKTPKHKEAKYVS